MQYWYVQNIVTTDEFEKVSKVDIVGEIYDDGKVNEIGNVGRDWEVGNIGNKTEFGKIN